MAVCCDDNTVAVGTSKSAAERSLRAYPVQRTWLLDEGLSISAVGLMSDAHVVADLAFDECSNHRLAFGTPPSPMRLAAAVADALAASARQSRPLGVHVVLAGAPNVLCHLHPSGRVSRVRALAAGKDAEALTLELARRMEDATVTDGPALLREVWRAALTADVDDDGSDLQDLDITVIRPPREQPPFVSTA